jgi:hypothetical protein
VGSSPTGRTKYKRDTVYNGKPVNEMSFKDFLDLILIRTYNYEGSISIGRCTDNTRKFRVSINFMKDGKSFGIDREGDDLEELAEQLTQDLYRL